MLLQGRHCPAAAVCRERIMVHCMRLPGVLSCASEHLTHSSRLNPTPSQQAGGPARGQRHEGDLQLLRGLGQLQEAQVRVEGQTRGWLLAALEVEDLAAGERRVVVVYEFAVCLCVGGWVGGNAGSAGASGGGKASGGGV